MIGRAAVAAAAARALRRWLVPVLALLLVTGCGTAQAARMASAAPQGEVARVRQVLLRFSDPMVALGDPSAGAPATMRCTDDLQRRAAGRWQDERSYAFDFDGELPAGIRCRVTLNRDLKDVGGRRLEGRREFAFSTGGPLVTDSNPSQGQIEEAQHFELWLNGPVAFDTIEKNAWCQARGINERIPLRIVERDPLAEGSPSRRGRPPVPAGRSVSVRCQRPLPADADVLLVWGRGIAGRTGVVRDTDQRLSFKVRPVFTASFGCQRPQADAPCSPLSPMRLAFSSPVPREVAAKAVLRGPAGARAPRLPDDEPMVEQLEFAAVHAQRSDFTVELPADLRDDSGRSLANAGMFPMRVRTGDLPALAKFPAAPFGIIELNDDATLPITVRNVEADLNVRALVAGQSTTASTLRLNDDAAVVRWQRRLAEYHERDIEVGQTRGRVPQPVYAQSRALSVFEGEGAGAVTPQRIVLPRSADERRPFEVIGLPLSEPGFHVVEVASRLLGRELLARDAPMYVRTGALVTNLAVHFKQGRENALVWVTTLDRAEPVAGAQVRISDCNGRLLWEGSTGRDGVAMVAQALPQPDCDEFLSGLMVSARKTDARGRADFSFAWSSWTQGIESWRFNLPTDRDPQPTVRAHTVFDRTLLRAGETVSMKHLLRVETMNGLVLPPAEGLPAEVRIAHVGSNQEYRRKLEWRNGRFAVTAFQIPREAKLGVYEVYLVRRPAAGTAAAARPPEGPDGDGPPEWLSGDFRVEEFRLPVLEGRIVPPAVAQVAVTEVPVDVQMGYLSGGPAAHLPVELSATVRARPLSFPDYEQYDFNLRTRGDGADEEGDGDGTRLVADRIALTLDRAGAGRGTIAGLKPATTPRELRIEARFNDPNGETQTLGSTVALYPAAVLVGLKTGGWVSVAGPLAVAMQTLDLQGRPAANVPVELRGQTVKRTTTRKRLVGGLYGYDTHTEKADLGVLCSGRSDVKGRFACDVRPAAAGQMELRAQARDADGRLALAGTDVWVTKKGDLWFDAENQDRIDVLPERKRYEPGQTATLQVRTPFRHATALVAIEREGVIAAQVVHLSGDDPTITVPVLERHGPNVFVSVLAVRGRVREVPWYSLFTWGWQAPRQWWRERQAGADHVAPTATVDLGKPAFRFGAAELRVGLAAHELKVAVLPERERYQVRETARVKIKVTLPDGRPVPAGTEVAVAAVDQALLELRANASWRLLDAMMQRRSWGVQTATAQMQVVGKRHYGRKALPPGGDGGRAPTRELFDTLLLWRAAVPVDAAGEATVEVPLNDSLTSVRIVAVADVGDDLFGHGGATIRSSQDLQLVSGLPPLVRDGDRFVAVVTVRNGSERAMSVRFAAASAVGRHDASLELAAGAAREIAWPVDVPVDAGESLLWELSAQDGGSAAADRLRIRQRVAEAVPVTVQQSTIAQIAGARVWPVAPPVGALPLRGGVAVQWQAKLSEGLPGVRRYFERYPFVCLEQRVSKAIGLRDAALWKTIVEQMPSHLDDDGLVDYFPPWAGNPPRGSDTLTAYLLSVTDEAARLDPVYAIPAGLRDRMERALIAFVEGRLKRETWAPQRDLTVRRLAALEALSRTGKVTRAMMETFDVDPGALPTSAVLDWYAALLRAAQVARPAALARAEQALRARLSWQGTRLSWVDEPGDFWWWLMANADANGAKLLALAVEQPGWKDEAPRLALGLLGRFREGRWMTTNANLLGALAIDKFSRRFEAAAVSGHSAAVLRPPDGADVVRSVDWPGGGVAVTLPWPASATSPAASPPVAAARATSAVLAIAHEGTGRPWVTVQSLAAVPLVAPVRAGFAVERTVEPVQVREPGAFSRGDVLRVRLKVTPQAPATWVVLTDPVPAGATILGSGLGRDSRNDERPGDTGRRRGWDQPWIAYEERAFEGYRAYYAYVAARPFEVEYSVRLNNPGAFSLPPTRVEAMYNPGMFGALPNATVTVKP